MSLEVCTLTESTSGARAKIVPGLGFNCYSWEVPTASGPLEVLWAAADFAAGTAKPSSSGIPLMFPFAGRIRAARFEFGGRDYALAAGDGLGNAIHGFVINRPWRVLKQTGDRVKAQFQASLDDASLLAHWPADFRITAEYQLTGGSLVSLFTIENPDTRPLPFGFGTHGYFRVPLGGRSSADCSVRVPVDVNWDLQGLLPTGQRSSPPLVRELAQGMSVGDMHLDHVFGGLKFDNHRCTTTVHDSQSGRTLTMTFDDQFTTCVVFNPPHREAVCIEPYTTVPDPFTLRAQGIDPHLQVLAPGAAFRTRIDMRLD
jgi:aldose 1-epimerase